MYTVKVWHQGVVRYYKCEGLFNAQFLVNSINDGSSVTGATAEIL